LLDHGGRLNAAARRFGIPRADWLDLSTGIAPWPYPLPPVPPDVWQRLPEDDDGLDEALCAHYGAPGLPVPGSQWAIRALPQLLPRGRVALPQPLYAEHPTAWQAAGHTLVAWDEAADYAVLCNPNNPTGALIPRACLLERAQRVRLLVVDEAFIDDDAQASLLGAHPNIVVLRSLGKFFGLAGVRVGFVFAAREWLDRLRGLLDPWAVSHPARWAARRALADRAWQSRQRLKLGAAAERLAALLAAHGLPNTGTALFRYAPTERAAEMSAALASMGILVRSFAAPPALRFGLPGAEAEWRRLERALQRLT